MCARAQLRLSFTGDFGPSTVSPRSLTSACISKLIKLEGIVTKCSLVRPKAAKTVHYSEAANTFVSKEYRDVASHLGLPTGSAYPTKDDKGNPLTTEYGLCTYKDHQVLVIQARPWVLLLRARVPCRAVMARRCSAATLHSCAQACSHWCQLQCSAVQLAGTSCKDTRVYVNTQAVKLTWLSR